MQFLNVILDLTKITDVKWKNAGVSRTLEVCHAFYAFLDLL